jgi:hypothetical protein
MSVFIHNFLMADLEKVATLMISAVFGIVRQIKRFFWLLLADFEIVE